MKKILTVFGVLVVLVGIGVGGNTYIQENRYNLNPDVSYKIVGSKDVPMEIDTIDNIKKLTQYGDAIVVGKIVSQPKEIKYNYTTGYEELDKDIKGDIGNNLYVKLTVSEVEIEEILCGEVNSSKINLAQVGTIEGDRGQTKVKYGDKMLMIIKQFRNDKTMYSPAIAEDGLFIIRPDNTTYSLSDNLFTSKYDNINYKILKEDIIKQLKKDKKYNQ